MLSTVTSHEDNLKVVTGMGNLTSVNGLVAGQIALVAESSLAVVTLVWLVTVDLGHVVFQGVFLDELGVTPVAVGVVFCTKQQRCTLIDLCEFI